jgi:hypothetical protein
VANGQHGGERDTPLDEPHMTFRSFLCVVYTCRDLLAGAAKVRHFLAMARTASSY